MSDRTASEGRGGIRGGMRGALGEALFARVAGPQGPENRRRIHHTPGPRWFAPDRPVRRVHGDASMFVGGLAALLLQSLHPLAMAAVAEHSGFRGDPWGRLARTSTFLAVTTFGTADDARQAVDQVRAIHGRVRGTTPDGTPYRADDPHLLAWVHIAEVASFLAAHQRFGARPLDPAGCDGYLADTARIAEALGAHDPPRDRAALAARFRAYRPELRATPEARETVRYLLRHPPLPWPARPPYALLAANAVGLLPPWARAELGLRRPAGVAEPLLVRPGGHLVTGTIRWAMGPGRQAAARGSQP
ncbi:oxygenase MpaB family protein [Streptomyces sp. NPDC046887]|uniref:oxygenase MpaB family protein n=1 Tax=Streptomyces sp. NPDC046887 TaxID=3155472 RepID=UPI0033FC0536